MKQISRILLLAAGISCLLWGCLPAPYFQKEEAIPGNAWGYGFRPSFTFNIEDTTVGYKPSFLIRHTQAYPYSNLWVILRVRRQGDSLTQKARVNIVLAEPSGKWLGRGMGEIYEQRLPIDLGDSIRFNRKGMYTVTMEQNMRVNPLPEVMNIGLEVEKDVPRRRR